MINNCLCSLLNHDLMFGEQNYSNIKKGGISFWFIIGIMIDIKFD